jgi:hypothetical protein
MLASVGMTALLSREAHLSILSPEGHLSPRSGFIAQSRFPLDN